MRSSRPLVQRPYHTWLAIAAPLALAGCGHGATTEPERAPSTVSVTSTAPAQAQTRPVSLSLDGTLVADEESRVTSVVAGRVVEVLVERGSRVEEGDPLVRLRDVDFRLNARAARAAVDQAEARLGMGDGSGVPRPEDTPDVQAAATELELARSALARAEQLHERGTLSDEAVEQARARAATAQTRHASALNGTRASIAALASARAQLSAASTSVSESVVRAPFSGEIAARMVSVGEYVSPQTPLVTLVRADPLRIEMQVPQRHLLDVQPGQRVTLRVDAVPDRELVGEIRYVSAAVDAQSRGLTVEAVIPNADGLLRPGLFATARIETGREESVAVVPAGAVLTQAGVSRVFVIEEGHVIERVVTIAERGDEGVVLRDGVAPGEVVATEGLDRLADGQRVEG